MYELDDEEFERLMARVDRMTPVQLLRLQCKVEALTRSNDEVHVQSEEPFDRSIGVGR